MSQMIPFEGSKLPAFLQAAASQVNNDLTANVGAGFPYLSIKGKNFTLIRGDERKMLTRKIDDEEIPASSVSVVILKANKNFSKVWYAKSFVEGSDAKPDCFSNNGDIPDPQSEMPQSKSCQTCKHNVWGSGRNENGDATKGKACQDARRIAVAAPGTLNDPMLVRIPPATLKPLAEYGNMLAKRGVPYNAVITKIKFDPEAATPKLLFEAVGFLTEEQYTEAEDVAKGSLVDDIIGGGIPLVIPEEGAVEPAKPKSTKKAEIKPAVSEDDIVEVSEKQVETKVAVKAETKEKTPPKVVEVDSDLDALLAELDD